MPTTIAVSGVARRRLRRAVALALVIVPMAYGFALWRTSRAPWLRMTPIRGPVSEGALLVPAQRAPMHVTFAPDGSPIVDLSAGGIVRVDPRDGSSRVLLPTTVQMVRPSPDGRQLAFETYHPRGDRVWVAPSDGSTAPRLIPNLSGRPVWTPDGKALVSSYISPSGHPPDRVGAGGTVRVDLADLSSTPMALPPTEAIEDWSRDGRSILTLSTRHYAPKQLSFEIYRMAPDGSDPVRLSSGGSNFNPRFSPDGRRVVYVRRTFGSGVNHYFVTTVNADGTGARELVHGLADDAWACWSPDGTALVVSTGHSIEIVAADGSWRRPLDYTIRPQRPMFGLPWGPETTGIMAVEWLSPPGR
jgi:dipeptidyl aminopeptidase/acylaminoacyl peptidase